MIEKINTEGYELISVPSQNVISFLEEFLMSSKKPICVAEIGVGIGATSIEIVKRLRRKDSFYFFSFESEVKELEDDLKGLNYCKCKLYPMGNSRTVYDSYNWKLSSLCLENEVLFDLVYLDGAHSFYHDALATALLKKLVKPGGVIIYDDVQWSFMMSPTMGPENRPQTLLEYTPEQIRSKQVKRALEVFMEPDEGWERIGALGKQAIYKKL